MGQSIKRKRASWLPGVAFCVIALSSVGATTLDELASKVREKAADYPLKRASCDD